MLLTGTLMGGYADDLFFLLWRVLTRRMIEDGFKPNRRGSLAPAALAFMREHGVLKDIYKETDAGSHKTAKGNKVAVHTKKAPGFGPKGIARFVLPYTAFLKLRDIGGNVLPPCDERLLEVPMLPEQADRYQSLRIRLVLEMKAALAKGDKTLLGVVLNVLLAWPDCAFRDEAVRHPRTGDLLAFAPAVFGELEPAPKELELSGCAGGRRPKAARCWSIPSTAAPATPRNGSKIFCRAKALRLRSGQASRRRCCAPPWKPQKERTGYWSRWTGALMCWSATRNWSRPAWTCWTSRR